MYLIYNTYVICRTQTQRKINFNWGRDTLSVDEQGGDCLLYEIRKQVDHNLATSWTSTWSVYKVPSQPGLQCETLPVLKIEKENIQARSDEENRKTLIIKCRGQNEWEPCHVHVHRKANSIMSWRRSFSAWCIPI